MMDRCELRMVGAVVVSFLLLTMACALILPPFEGFDENGHYSYISFLADHHQVPDFRTTPLDRRSSDMFDQLPRAYSAYSPFEQNGGKTYRDFFNHTPDSERRAIVRHYWQAPDHSLVYVPQEGANATIWIAQHPPLYYLVMTLPYHVTRSASPGTRLFVMRLCSTLLACGSLVFWCKLAWLCKSTAARWTILLSGVAVLFFPSGWYDVARVGNDSLVALLSSATFYFVIRAYRNRQARIGDHVAIAVTLGLGLLTKAFFLPFYAGVIVWFLWVAIVHRPLPWLTWLSRFAVLVVVPILISAPWFWLCWQRYGSPLVTYDSYEWSRPGVQSLGDLLPTGGFWWGMLRTQIGPFVKSFIWSSTRSYVRQPLWLYGLGAAFVLLAAFNIVRRRWKTADADSRQLALLAAMLLVPLILSIGHYMYLIGRFQAFQTNVGGYYLFSAWLPLGVFLGRAFDGIGTRWGKCLALVALGLSLFVEIYGVWLLAQVYSGIVHKMGTNPSPIGHVWPTPQNLVLVYSRLREIVFPGWAMLCYLLSWPPRLMLIRFVLSEGGKRGRREKGPSLICPGTARLTPAARLVPGFGSPSE